MPKGIYPRGNWWWARFKVAGVSYREPLRIPVRGPKEERAAAARSEELRKQVIDEVRFGIAAPVSWQQAVLAWNDAAIANRLRPATIRRYLTSLGQLRDQLDGKTVQELDAAEIRKLITARRRDGASNATLRRDLTALSQVLGHAIAQGWRKEGDNPARGIDRKRQLPERRDPICLPLPGEVAAVIAAAPQRFGDLIAFAHETGMRQEEVASLEHNRIDRARNCAMIYRAKARRPRAVPLTPAALAIIERQPRHLKLGWVFWHDLPPDPRFPDKELSTRFTSPASNFRRIRAGVAQKVARKGGTFTGFRFHDLRHDFAVRYLRDGGSIYTLQEILGHSSIKTTEIYLDYLTPEEKQQAMAGAVAAAEQGRETA